MYGVGKIVGGPRLGTLSALLLAISPWHVAYGQEARMYALLTLWTTLAIYGLARLLTGSEVVNEPSARGVGWSWRGSQAPYKNSAPWLAYIGGTAAALWTQSMALFLPIATNLVVLSWWSIHHRVDSSFLRKWCFAQIAVLLLWSP
jgi:uncharacterized membrane protein